MVQNRSNSDTSNQQLNPVAVQLAAIAKKLESIDVLRKDVATLKSQSYNKERSSNGSGMQDEGDSSWHHQRYRPYNKVAFPTFNDGDLPGHRCKTSTLRVLEVEEEPDEQPINEVDYIAGDANDVAEISLHAILGKPHPITMKVQGVV
ncbi:hypothetical protein Tco_0413705 [Tanacetum coccineum]